MIHPPLPIQCKRDYAPIAATGLSAALPDELVDDIAFIGSASECQEKIRWCADNGVHTQIMSCIQPLPEIYTATVNAFGAEQFSF